ncbi:hypothetical protein IUY40_00725 [Flavobacterium sp. ALJ2]|uniref:hypothetical protein n=1 Tax=Flavobacterium sp. ALJ2 TaxID=2786960 RepID=UPI00189E5562|nr:hypothetical protein [Flavobacterium sp. ALJ2]MBF7090067.1 hypothetical protein [Flavobacterium sp. ALJ2]
MIKKIQSLSLIFIFLCLTSCESTSPQRFFDQAILNTNLLSQFEPHYFGDMLEKHAYENPNPSSTKKGNEAQKAVEIKIQHIEQALEKIKVLDANDEERKAIKENSIELFETALAVYKNEYLKYAKFCDEKSTSTEKEVLLKKIEEVDMPKINNLMDSLYQKGKVFADKHQINVKW